MADTSWDRIEAEAREQKSAEYGERRQTPLEFGAHIVWSEYQANQTNGFSEVHRVGFPQFGQAYATCGELIPGPLTWFPLTPALVRVMDRCKYCEAEMARIIREQAA